MPSIICGWHRACTWLISDHAKVMLRIETITDGRNTVLRFMGRIQSEHLADLKAQIGRLGNRVVLDLAGVTLVDVDVVRFLGICEVEGIEVLHCAPYIREWILRELDRSA